MDLNHELLSFIHQSPTMYHAAASAADILRKAGFVELKESDSWQLEKGGAYFTTRNGSSLLAWKMPKDDYTGFMITAAHSDSPLLKIKENAEVSGEGYVRLSVEKYGGTLLSPWLDRPLGIAGRITVRDKDGFHTCLVNSEKPVAIIPNVAIHMNREANEKASYNMAVDMLPLYKEEDSALPSFKAMIASLAGVKEKDILTTDLYLYNCQAGTLWHDYISSPRLDDLQCAFAGLQALLNCKVDKAVPLLCIFDNEEVGSYTIQGADSTLLSDVLERIFEASGKTGQERMTALRNSFMVSADNGHAVHPNHPEYKDPNHAPRMNKGVVIKYNASQSYTSDAVSAAVFKLVCEKAKVPYQYYANRADLRGGSTLGNISSSHVSIHTVDIGLAQLAMHSCYETAGAKDMEYLFTALKAFFSQTLTCDKDQYTLQ